MIFWISSLSMPGKCPAPCGLASSSAGGNPFFLEEIVLHLMQEHPGPEIEDVQIPDTVRVLAARMDLLPASEKRVLQTASVVGRTF